MPKRRFPREVRSALRRDAVLAPLCSHDLAKIEVRTTALSFASSRTQLPNCGSTAEPISFRVQTPRLRLVTADYFNKVCSPRGPVTAVAVNDSTTSICSVERPDVGSEHDAQSEVPATVEFRRTGLCAHVAAVDEECCVAVESLRELSADLGALSGSLDELKLSITSRVSPTPS